ncbi:hypothetical protein GOV05_00715 [Candidatus Woesearchaeota archaeon]|nr:hypothetical protein [Candidatus Woesearchaeota archaeon]
MSDKIVEEILSENTEKTCFICEKKPAKYCIKGRNNDCYCKSCATEAFGSVKYLETIK